MDIVKRLLVILVFSIMAVLLRLDTIVWILKNITAIAVTAFLVVFQPELGSPGTAGKPESVIRYSGPG